MQANQVCIPTSGISPSQLEELLRHCALGFFRQCYYLHRLSSVARGLFRSTQTEFLPGGNTGHLHVINTYNTVYWIGTYEHASYDKFVWRVVNRFLGMNTGIILDSIPARTTGYKRGLEFL